MSILNPDDIGANLEHMIGRTNLYIKSLILFVVLSVVVVTTMVSKNNSTNFHEERTQNISNLQCPNIIRGDFDCNTVIDLADFDRWLKEFQSNPKDITADANGDNRVSLIDYEIWRVGLSVN